MHKMKGDRMKRSNFSDRSKLRKASFNWPMKQATLTWNNNYFETFDNTVCPNDSRKNLFWDKLYLLWICKRDVPLLTRCKQSDECSHGGGNTSVQCDGLTCARSMSGVQSVIF